jgi:hypothetical protein
MTPAPHHITQLLNEWGNGDQAALDRLMPLVYAELRRMARRHMNQQRPGHTLQTTLWSRGQSDAVRFGGPRALPAFGQARWCSASGDA